MLPAFEGTDFEAYGLGMIADKTKSKDRLYIDHTHLSPAGARAVAELMLDKMWPYVLSWVHTGNPKMRWPSAEKSN